MAAEAI